MNTVCPLCTELGGELIHHGAEWRVIRVVDADFPAFYRVISRNHVAEWSELSAPQRDSMMSAVVRIEEVLRSTLQPSKINLATLGNVVPHLHWHVIARFDWDSHFPQPIWGQRQRESVQPAVERLACSLAELDERVRRAFES